MEKNPVGYVIVNQTMQPDIYIYETKPTRRDQSGHKHLRDA